MTAQRQDIVLGSVFAALGLAAAFKAASYSGASGVYPMALSLAMAALGGLVALKAVVRGHPDPRPLVDNGARAVLTMALGVTYLALVPVLGFYFASALITLALPLALGFRRPVYSAITALIFILTVWVVFSLILEKPLPSGFWSSY